MVRSGLQLRIADRREGAAVVVRAEALIEARRAIAVARVRAQFRLRIREKVAERGVASVRVARTGKRSVLKHARATFEVRRGEIVMADAPAEREQQPVAEASGSDLARKRSGCSATTSAMALACCVGSGLKSVFRLRYELALELVAARNQVVAAKRQIGARIQRIHTAAVVIEGIENRLIACARRAVGVVAVAQETLPGNVQSQSSASRSAPPKAWWM